MEETVGSEYIQRHRYDAHHRHIGIYYHDTCGYLHKLVPPDGMDERGIFLAGIGIAFYTILV
jgi:hypothetical protein